MDYLKVKNWDEWQTYRTDRGAPPWIKVHRNLMTSHKWATLSDQEKGQLVSIWIAAADHDGSIPDDCRIIQKICGLDSPPDIEKLIDIGFLERQQNNDAEVTPERRQSDAPETETETETEEPSLGALRDLHQGHFGAIPISKTQDDVLKRWVDEGKSFDLIRSAYEKAAGAKPATRWGWITDIVEGRAGPHKSNESQGISQTSKGLAVLEEMKRRVRHGNSSVVGGRDTGRDHEALPAPSQGRAGGKSGAEDGRGVGGVVDAEFVTTDPRNRCAEDP